MYLSLVLFPLLGFISASLFGRFIGRSGSCFITTLLLFSSLSFSILAFLEVGLNQTACVISLNPWFDVGVFHGGWGFLFDSITCVMLIVVTFVSTLVHIYSIEYMGHDPHQVRFMSYLSLFTFFMLILVTGDNFLQLFLGWEGVGLASYLLINFWYSRIQANKSAIKAMLVNRVGDFGLALGIASIFFLFRAVDYFTVFALTPSVVEHYYNFLLLDVHCLTFITFLLFFGAVGKSAQIGLHTWLPDAMEGPTPVSALIHAATMVTAGVFLVIRCSPIFEFAPQTLSIVAIIGALTAVFAATSGLVQNDMKRVIAYSTCSQLGYMIMACGLSQYSLGLFHLANHAFFKALLFLSAGSIIHGLCDEQDMRKMGGLTQLFPFTYPMILIGSLSLMGLPFLTGFYSKDAIIELAFAGYNFKAGFTFFWASLCVIFTSFYSIRLILLVFVTEPNTFKAYIANTHEAPLLMLIPMFLLSIGSLFIGYLTRDLMVGFGSTFWGNSIFVFPKNQFVVDFEFMPTLIKQIPLLFTVFGTCLSIYLVFIWRCNREAFVYSDRKLTLNSGRPLTLVFFNLYKQIIVFLSKKWHFDQIYNQGLANKIHYLGYKNTFALIDKGLIEFLGPHGVSNLIQYVLIRSTIKSQSGLLYNYVFFIVFGMILAAIMLLLYSKVTIATAFSLFVVYSFLSFL